MDDGIDYRGIDAGIRSLCRAINAYEEFATLNSCQGHYAPDAVEASTRRGPAGPYVIFGHPDPETDDAVDTMLQELEDVVRECDQDAAYHGGAFVKQLYPDAEEAEREGRSSYTVTHPYRDGTVPPGWVDRFAEEGKAVELVVDEEECSGLDRGEPTTGAVGDVTYCASVIDFQAFTGRWMEPGLEDGSEELIARIAEERDDLLDRLEAAVEGLASSGPGRPV